MRLFNQYLCGIRFQREIRGEGDSKTSVVSLDSRIVCSAISRPATVEADIERTSAQRAPASLGYEGVHCARYPALEHVLFV